MVSVKQNGLAKDAAYVKAYAKKYYPNLDETEIKSLLREEGLSKVAINKFVPVGVREKKAEINRGFSELKRHLESGGNIFNMKQNGSGGLSQHIDAAFDAAASGDRGGLTTTKAAIRTALNKAKQPEGQKAREYIFSVLDIIVKNRSSWSGAQTAKAVKEYSAAVYDKVLPKLNIKENPSEWYYQIWDKRLKRWHTPTTYATRELAQVEFKGLDGRRYQIVRRIGSNFDPMLHRRNHTATDFITFKENRSKEHFKMFQGKRSSGAVSVLQPDSAPKETSRLGDLVLMKVIKSNGSKQNINFDGEAFLAIDLRKNLWAIGKDARINNVALPRKGELKYLGKLKQIDYVTAKKHIGGNKLTRFWHELGEVDKNYPSLYVDADGFPIIHGGGYDVWNVGIVN